MSQPTIMQRPHAVLVNASQFIIRHAKRLQQRERAAAKQRQREYVSALEQSSRRSLLCEKVKLLSVYALAALAVVAYALVSVAVVGGQVAIGGVPMDVAVRLAAAIVGLLVGVFVALVATDDARRQLQAINAELLWRRRQKRSKAGYRSVSAHSSPVG